MHFQNYQFYSNAANPAQVVNLAKRGDIPSLAHYFVDRSIKKVTDDLQERLMAHSRSRRGTSADRAMAVLSVRNDTECRPRVAGRG